MTTGAMADRRSRLAHAEAALVRALVSDAPVPPGFDPTRVRFAGAALIRKRTRVVVRLWPGLAGAVGPRFAALFAAHAARHPLPEACGGTGDGLAFVRRCVRATDLPDGVRLQLLRLQAHLVVRGGRVRHRRAPAVKLAFLRGRRRLVVALVVPGRRARSLTVPLGRGGQIG